MSIKTIYSGGFIPDLGVKFDPDSSQHGWLFFLHPNGRWVTLADLKPYIAEFPPNPCDVEKIDLWRRINGLEEVNAELQRALVLANTLHSDLVVRINELHEKASSKKS